MDINRINEFFDNDKFARMTGAVIEEITDSSVVCSLSLNENHYNAGGTVQGGAVFTLADFAFAVASNLADLKAGNEAITISQSSAILFFRPANGDKLIAKTACLQKGRKISVYRVTILDSPGTTVAEMTVTAYRIAKEKNSA